MIRIAFDVDGTLLNEQTHAPLADNIQILKLLKKYAIIIVWSGAGAEHAEQTVKDLGLTSWVDFCMAKAPDIQPDIIFDNDPTIQWGRVNIWVK